MSLNETNGLMMIMMIILSIVFVEGTQCTWAGLKLNTPLVKKPTIVNSSSTPGNL